MFHASESGFADLFHRKHDSLGVFFKWERHGFDICRNLWVFVCSQISLYRCSGVKNIEFEISYCLKIEHFMSDLGTFVYICSEKSVHGGTDVYAVGSLEQNDVLRGDFLSYFILQLAAVAEKTSILSCGKSFFAGERYVLSKSQ